MVILDTDVFSAIMRIEHNPAVREWLEKKPLEDLVITSPTLFELLRGIDAKPASIRRKALETRFEIVLTTQVSANVLPLDADAAREAARIRNIQLGSGRNVALADSLIAGIAAARKLPLATRNIKDFSDLGLTLIDPWKPT